MLISIAVILALAGIYLSYKIGFYLGKIRGWTNRGEMEKARKTRFVSEWEAGNFLER